MVNIVLKKESKVGGIPLPNFKSGCKAKVIMAQCGISEGIDTQINRTY
jgi:hypothetical protein